MGVPKLYGWLRNNQLFQIIILEQLPPEADIFLIDVNGLIHGGAQHVFGYGEKPRGTSIVQNVGGQLLVSPQDLYNRRYAVYQYVFDNIIRLTRIIRPRRSLVIAVDGVPPEAKIMQQRGRRFGAASTRPPEQAFDSNSINPGTEFMMDLDRFIRDKLKEIDDAERARVPHPYGGVLPPYVLYSSHMVPGEGEHKIADYMRTVPAEGQTAVVYGTDADLIMIYLLNLQAGWKNIFLFRENSFRGRTEVATIDLQQMAAILRNLYPGVPAPLDDFTTLLSLNGNDFLPHFAAFERITDALQTLIFGYRGFLNENPGKGICTPDNIHWENFGLFTKFIADRYNDTLLKIWAENADNLVKIPSLVAERCTVQSRFVQGTELKCVREFHPEKFRDEWYTYVFSPKAGQGKILPTAEDLDLMVKYYLEGIAWVHHYYKFGVSRLNVGWYYPYHYAPVFPDVPAFIQTNPVTWEVEPLYMTSEFVSPLEQMLQVMPPASINVIPVPIRSLYSEASPIFDLYPTDFVVDNTGTIELWLETPILPFPLPLRVHRALDMLRLPQEYLDQFAPQENLEIIRDINRAYQPSPGARGGRGRGGRGGPPRGGRGGSPSHQGRTPPTPQSQQGRSPQSQQGRGAPRGGRGGRGGSQGRGGNRVPPARVQIT
jgi:5'-3' exonuclease